MFEGLKKLWRQVENAVEEANGGVIRMGMGIGIDCQNVHDTTQVDLFELNKCPLPSIGDNEQGTPIDKEIAVLVAEMNRVGIETTCSCQGHGGEAYVSIRLGEGTTYNHRKDIFGPGQDELTLKWRRNIQTRNVVSGQHDRGKHSTPVSICSQEALAEALKEAGGS